MNGRISDADAKLLIAEIGGGDLPESWQEMVDIIGIKSVLEICRRFGGISLYVPKLESVIAPAKRRAILKEFKGNNYRGLAKRFDISERNVYDIVAEDNWQRNQQKLF